MSEIVFILGAGASREAGAPLMADFLERAEGLLRAGRCGKYEDDFKRVFESRNELQRVHSKAALDLDNFESVFGAFEMASLIGQLPGTDTASIPQIADSMRRLITKTLEESIEFPYSSVVRQPVEPYNSFGHLIKELNRKSIRASILTFNYDVVIDFALQYAGVPITYCLGIEDSSPKTKLLKLHGSLNWMMCSEPDCGQLLPWYMGDYLEWPGSRPQGSGGTWKMEVGSNLSSSHVKHAGTRHDSLVPRETPVIVPPTWNKTEHHRSLCSVWREAANELKTAEHIMVIGYSLPDSDAFFKYLYALSYESSVRTSRFCVFDPAGEVRARFQQLLGQDVARKYVAYQSKFSEAIRTIRSLLLPEGKSVTG